MSVNIRSINAEGALQTSAQPCNGVQSICEAIQVITCSAHVHGSTVHHMTSKTVERSESASAGSGVSKTRATYALALVRHT